MNRNEIINYCPLSDEFITVWERMKQSGDLALFADSLLRERQEVSDHDLEVLLLDYPELCYFYAGISRRCTAEREMERLEDLIDQAYCENERLDAKMNSCDDDEWNELYCEFDSNRSFIEECREELEAWKKRIITFSVSKYSYSNCLVRPCGNHWAIYHVCELNKANVIFEGTREDCYNMLDELCK